MPLARESAFSALAKRVWGGEGIEPWADFDSDIEDTRSYGRSVREWIVDETTMTFGVVYVTEVGRMCVTGCVFLPSVNLSRKFFANFPQIFRKFSANFPQIFRKFFANFSQIFRKFFANLSQAVKKGIQAHTMRFGRWGGGDFVGGKNLRGGLALGRKTQPVGVGGRKLAQIGGETIVVRNGRPSPAHGGGAMAGVYAGVGSDSGPTRGGGPAIVRV